jgi:hypothetical protein
MMEAAIGVEIEGVGGGSGEEKFRATNYHSCDVCAFHGGTIPDVRRSLARAVKVTLMGARVSYWQLNRVATQEKLST